jgi:hypothetical protein
LNCGSHQPGKSLYTTVRELVENALDSAESISELPEVEVTIEEIVKSKFNSMIGLIDRERVDTQLYDDYETEKARGKRLAKEARASEIQAKNLASGKKNKEPGVSKVLKARGEASYYKVTCKDNGKGMPHDDIPNMFGRVLSGTKYGLKQTRGKFGLGAKMALIWSKMSTGLPIEISSSMKSQNYVTFCRLDIDIHRYPSEYMSSFSKADINLIFYVWAFDIIAMNPSDFPRRIIVFKWLKFSGTFLIFICTKRRATKRNGMGLKYRWLSKETGQHTDQRSCTICAKWLSLLLMRSFCLDLYQRHQRKMSLLSLLEERM